jgi:outer membrane protein OmpA-like peptidoglycan-associated protein
MGAQGRVGVVDRWTSYRDFWFEFNSAEIQGSEQDKLTTIATYMQKNPSLQLGIDGSMNARGTDPRDQNLSDRRVSAVRDALVAAGVSNAQIRMGAFGDPNLRQDRRVEVLIATAN